MTDRHLLYRYTAPVRWSDMDALGHVNNAVYFTYCEQARIQWLEENRLGGSIAPGTGEGPVIINASCTFHRAVTYPAALEVSMFAGAVGRSSLETLYEIRDAADPERLYTSGSAKIVWVDHRAGRSVPLPAALRALLPSPPAGGLG